MACSDVTKARNAAGFTVWTNNGTEPVTLTHATGPVPGDYTGPVTIPPGGSHFWQDDSAAEVCFDCAVDEPMPDFLHPTLESQGFALKAAPGLEGHGSDTVAGRGGDVVFVSDAAELEAALAAPGAANIVPIAGGLWQYVGLLNPSGGSNKTFWGQMAPAPVILCREDPQGEPLAFSPGLRITSGTDMLLMHLTSRPDPWDGNNSARDGIDLQSCARVVLKNVTTSWTNDEGVDLTNGGQRGSDILIWMLHSTEHMIEQGSDQTSHVLMKDQDRVTLVFSLMTMAQQRAALVVDCTDYDQRYTIVYNHRRAIQIEARDDATAYGNGVNNLFIEGPDSAGGVGVRHDLHAFSNQGGSATLHHSGNIGVDATGTQGAPIVSGAGNSPGGVYDTDNAFPCPAITDILNWAGGPAAFEAALVEAVGHRLPFRDPVEVAQLVRFVGRQGTWTPDEADLTETKAQITPYTTTYPAAAPAVDTDAIDGIPADLKASCYPNDDRTPAEWNAYDTTKVSRNGGAYTDFEVIVYDLFGC